MLPKRALSSIVVRASSSAIRGAVRPRQSLAQQAAKNATRTEGRGRIESQWQQIRWQSQATPGSDGESRFYEFKDIQKLIHTNPSTSASGPILIDTREPAELQATGRIPSAINIPVSSSPDAFFLSEEEFEDKFGFARPGKEVEVVFYCKAGVRSRAAATLAKRAGWGNVGEYAGSWVDWEENGGVVEK